MKGLTVVFGHGTIGRLVTASLLARGDAVRIARRKRPADLSANAEFIACDILKPESVRQAVAGASQVLLSVGFPYDSRVWRRVWPITMKNLVEACSGTGVRVVFIDNLYQLGPQREPRREDMALSNHGNKAAILSQVTRIWMDAKDRVKLAALRCTDFYGPAVTASHLGASGLGALANKQAATLLVPPDIPHDFAYVPDIARAAVTLLDAPDDAFGQIWNMPCAPTRTPREILQLGAAAAGAPMKVRVIPMWMLPALGLFSRLMAEVVDIGFTWDRPYVVDAAKFKKRFWSDVTPFEEGVVATVRSFAKGT